VIGHLGTRVSALLDGQLAREDEDRAWEHLHSCHQCRDQVECEG
jgi:predicted anti-sigma-YlaC factor YlaD